MSDLAKDSLFKWLKQNITEKAHTKIVAIEKRSSANAQEINYFDTQIFDLRKHYELETKYIRSVKKQMLFKLINK